MELDKDAERQIELIQKDNMLFYWLEDENEYDGVWQTDMTHNLIKIPY